MKVPIVMRQKGNITVQKEAVAHCTPLVALASLPPQTAAAALRLKAGIRNVP
jgi:hypothetical protein